MKVFIYKDGLCDPLKNIGACRQLYRAKDVDDYISLFVISLDVNHLHRFRFFITDDDVEFVEMDHFVFMGEPLTTEARMKKIEEVDLVERKRQVHMALNARLSAREKRIAEMKKAR